MNKDLKVLAVGTKYVKGFADWSGQAYSPYDLQMVPLEDYAKLKTNYDKIVEKLAKYEKHIKLED